jgi:glucose/mannose-6-phosphate isomerase
MMLLNRLGFSPYGVKEFEALAVFLDKRAALLESHIPSEDNPAKQLALRLYGRIPVIYSGPQTTNAVATRFKGQINENAKMPAFANQFPEMNHNELVGWKVIQAFRDYLRILILRDRQDHARVAARMDIVGKMIEKEKIEVIEIQSEGEDVLQRVFSLIQLGDFVSYYLAILNNVDPTPVAPISFLKEELAKIG